MKNRIVSDGEKNLQLGACIIFGIFVGILCIWHLAGGSGGEDSWFNEDLMTAVVGNVTGTKICNR